MDGVLVNGSRPSTNWKCSGGTEYQFLDHYGAKDVQQSEDNDNKSKIGLTINNACER
jgi:hypothetical protein